MGFGVQILFVLLLGLLVLGPKQLLALLNQAARARKQLENATRGFKSQLSAQLDVGSRECHTDQMPESDGHLTGSSTIDS